MYMSIYVEYFSVVIQSSMHIMGMLGAKFVIFIGRLFIEMAISDLTKCSL